MKDIDYDLSLEGDALYKENVRKWTEFHKNCDLFSVNRITQEVQAIYNCPSKKTFESMKRVNEIMKFVKWA